MEPCKICGKPCTGKVEWTGGEFPCCWDCRGEPVWAYLEKLLAGEV